MATLVPEELIAPYTLKIPHLLPGSRTQEMQNWQAVQNWANSFTTLVDATNATTSYVYGEATFASVTVPVSYKTFSNPNPYVYGGTALTIVGSELRNTTGQTLVVSGVFTVDFGTLNVDQVDSFNPPIVPVCILQVTKARTVGQGFPINPSAATTNSLGFINWPYQSNAPTSFAMPFLCALGSYATTFDSVTFEYNLPGFANSSGTVFGPGTAYLSAASMGSLSAFPTVVT